MGKSRMMIEKTGVKEQKQIVLRSCPGGTTPAARLDEMGLWHGKRIMLAEHLSNRSELTWMATERPPRLKLSALMALARPRAAPTRHQPRSGIASR